MAEELRRKTAGGVAPAFFDSGIEVKPVYTAGDAAAGNGAADERPGEYPFTRGIHPEMYRRRPWTMRQYTGFGNAEATNERFHYLIRTGNTGLNVAFDLPSQCGLDSDDPAAAGEVGRVGMAVDSLRDFEVAFDGVDLDRITVSLTVNGSAAIMIAMYLAMAEKRGFALDTLRGTAQNDILKEMVGRGTWIFPVEPSIRLVGDTIEYCARHAPSYSPVSVCGYHIRESGCNPAEEMAYAFLIAKAYIDETLRRGLAIDEFAGRFSFNFNVFGKLFEEVAKFRAGRRLWATILREEYGAEDPKTMWMRMIAGGGGFGLTIDQPENNIMRGAYYALSAVLSGAQTIALCCYDEAYTIPSPKAQQISIRTMQLLIEELGLCDTADPLGGSYFVESMTDGMEERIRAVMQQVEADGGIVGGIAGGRIQDHVSRQAYEHHLRVESGEARKVGVNCHRVEEETPDVEFHPERKEDLELQLASLETIRAERDGAAVARALARVRSESAAGANVMPAIMEAVRAYATVGEITGVLVGVHGRYREPVAA